MLGVTAGLDACAAFLVPPTWGSHSEGLGMNDNTRSSNHSTRLFRLGQIVGTPGALGALRDASVEVAIAAPRNSRPLPPFYAPDSGPTRLVLVELDGGGGGRE